MTWSFPIRSKRKSRESGILKRKFKSCDYIVPSWNSVEIRWIHSKLLNSFISLTVSIIYLLFIYSFIYSISFSISFHQFFNHLLYIFFHLIIPFYFIYSLECGLWGAFLNRIISCLVYQASAISSYSSRWLIADAWCLTTIARYNALLISFLNARR